MPLGADRVMTGWPIVRGRELTYRARDNTVALKVYGLSEVFVVAAVSTDATLSGLALEYASDNSAIALTPSPFAATTTSYTASVARDVDESNATFVFLDGNEGELTDADTSQDDSQVSLSEGANTIKVKVTAEDTSTTATHTVTVTRAPNAAPIFTNGASTSRDFNETIGDAAVSTASNIGTPVAVADTDAADTLAYTLEDTDAAKFGIIPTNGQIQTKAGGKFDYEAKSSYAVTVKVENGNGGSDTIAVTLDVTDQGAAPLASNAPSVTATSGSTTSLDVSWTAPSNTGRPAVTSYDLQYKKTIDDTWTEVPQNVTTTSACISSLVAEAGARDQRRGRRCVVAERDRDDQCAAQHRADLYERQQHVAQSCGDRRRRDGWDSHEYGRTGYRD